MNNVKDWMATAPTFDYQDVYFAYLDLLGYKGIIREKGPEAPRWLYMTIRDALFGSE